MRFVRLVAGAAFGSLLAAAGCSQQDAGREALGIADQPLQVGDQNIDTTNKYGYAVGVCLGNNRGNCQGICSGTLVLPNLVITARHCVSETPESVEPTDTFGPAMGGPQNFFITTHYRMFQGTTGWHNVKQVLVPTENTVYGNDIALLILSDQVPAAEAKPVIPGIQYSMGDTRYTINYTAIGYGKRTPTDNQSSGIRRFKMDQSLLCVPDDPNLACPEGALISPKEFYGDDGTCQGDSGSGAFEKSTFDKGTPVSWGVLSRGRGTITACKGSAYTRLDAWRDFVVEGARQASEDWKLYPKPTPDWTVYVPPTPKDGGTTKPPTPKPGAGAELGATCAVDGDCASGICIDAPDGSRVCSSACEDGTDLVCPEGFVCSDAACLSEALVTTTPATATPPKDGGGCSTSSGATASGGLPLLGAALGLAVAASRRRRRDRSATRT